MHRTSKEMRRFEGAEKLPYLLGSVRRVVTPEGAPGCFGALASGEEVP